MTFYVFFEMTFQKVVKSHTLECLSHSCTVSCVHTSEHDLWYWWPWLIGTDFQ